jgi:hypothetical protein
MGSTHITVKNADGDDPKRKWHTTETYKVDDSVATQLAGMETKPTGPDLVRWLEDHGGKLDDGNGKAARISTKNDGTVINAHYKDGEYGTSEVKRPKGAHHDNSGAQLILALMTGGASIFVTPFMDDKDHAGKGSKFAETKPAATQPDEPGPKSRKAKHTPPAPKQ